ncbi:MAG: preprotein translocase subunit SecE [Clostridia bacterium]|nr:preprotein translocase subunit SecE [Clostridia bacterium]
MCIVAILVKDAVACKESGELTIPKKLVKFLREYKSELKKVVWPGPRSVIKNTLVVLAVCAAALLLIWLVDLGLGELFDLCFKS